ncbi:TPA: inovirus Gp2 family protein [Vibrio vulnificus]|nr:inovirus Gp2 family protein [Vibrio vulnificus]
MLDEFNLQFLEVIMYSTKCLTILNESTFHGLDVITKYDLCSEYLNGIRHVLNKAMDEYTRVAILRFDLHLPKGVDCPDYPLEYDSSVITRFIESFKAQLQADRAKKKREGKRYYRCTVRYVWAKEISQSVNPHYHVALVLNRDAYFGFGRYGELNDNLAGKIYRAWASALALSPDSSMSLIHIPENPVYSLDKNSQDYPEQRNTVFHRLSYLAKFETKHYGNKGKNFATSRL